jgi:polysaccharide pyruvyl transferase WcaK-like protein
MYKACLLGAAFDTGNMGVSALAASFFTIVKNVKEDSELFLLAWRSAPGFHVLRINDFTCWVNIVNCRMSPRSDLQQHIFWILLLALAFRYIPLSWLRRRVLSASRWLRTIHEADFIGSIHGGDSFSDIYGLPRLIFGVLTDLSVLLMGKKLVLLPQTYGPYRTRVARCLARLVMKKSGAILARDAASLNTARGLLGSDFPSKPIALCPDVAFILPAVLPKPPQIEPPLPEGKAFPLIGLNVSGLLYHGGYSRNNMFGLKLDYRRLIEMTVLRFMETTSAHILLVPHTFAPAGDVESDPDACTAIQDRARADFSGRVHRVAAEYGPSELKGLISLCDFFIGSRMHACIGALSQGIATVGIAYSKKFAGVFDSVREGALVVDARALDLDTALSSVMQHFAGRQKFQEALSSRLLEIRREIPETLQSVAAIGIKAVSPSIPRIQ